MRTISEFDRQAEVAAGGVATAPPKPCAVTVVAHDIGGVGGMERVLGELITGLVDAGHRVVVVARTCELPADTPFEFHRVRGPSRPFLLAYPCFMIAGSLALRRWRAGVVHAAGAIVISRVDVIAVHYCHQVGPANPSRPTALFRAHSRVAGYLKRAGERLCYGVLGSRATFACVSDGVADEVRTYFPAARERVLTVYNGVDVSAFAPGANAEQARTVRSGLGVGNGRLVAAFVGRSEWARKGLDVLVEALALAPEWDVAVVGSGDRSTYESLAAKLGVGGRIHWLGVMSDMQSVYALSDAFVLPSAYETFSLVTFEAAASGLPVVATAVSGVRELIADGETGFLVGRDPGEIAARLQQLAADPQLRRRLGRAARDAAVQFGSERMVADHRALYQRLAGAGAGLARG